MPWTFKISTGEMLNPDGSLLAVGGAGCGAGFNNPAMQNVVNVGPIPVGKYLIAWAISHPGLGPVAMRLYSHPSNNMFGRSDFWLHGWSATLGIKQSSNGCVLLTRSARDIIAASDDRVLNVVEGG